MQELSLHILDIVQNSIQADAKHIEINVEENSVKNLYLIRICDNGKGIDKETLQKVLNPFYTSKAKKTGLGIPLLKQHAELAGGNLHIESELGSGTTVTATFKHNNIDRQPMGDIASTLCGLIRSYPAIRFKYKHKIESNEFYFDTEEIKAQLEEVSIETPEIIRFIKELITSNIEELESQRNITNKNNINA